MANTEIRCALIEKGIRHYELADYLGLVDVSLSRKLRKELPPEEKERILAAIERLAKGEC